MNPEVNPDSINSILGRPVLNSVSMHLHVKFLIMIAALEHPERTLGEIVENV